MRYWMIGVVTACGVAVGVQGNVVTSPVESAEVKALRQAHELLRSADHDYQGHRVKAMHEIADACHLLGVTVTAGEPKVESKRKEPLPQGESDARLRKAEGIVKEVMGAIPAGKQTKVKEELREAVKQIDTALSIR